MTLWFIKLHRLLLVFVFSLRRWLSKKSRNINNTRPAIIISYDDGYLSDYIKAYPLHKKAGAIAETCVISGRIGQDGYMDIEQLLELQKSGWEVVSHSRNHNPLNDSFLLEHALKGDNKIAVDHPYRFQKGSDCIIGKGKKRESVRIASISEDYLFIEKKLANRHRRFESLRISDASLMEEVAESRNDLIGMGLRVQNFTFPYNAFSEWSIKAVKEFYDSARAERLLPIGKGSLNKNIGGCSNRFYLNSYQLAENRISKSDITAILDKTQKKAGVCIFYAHTADAEFNTDLLEFIFEEAGRRNIPFVTRNMLL